MTPSELPDRIQDNIMADQLAFTLGGNASFGRRYSEYYARYGSFTDAIGVHFEQDAMTYAHELATALEFTSQSLLNDYPAPPGTTKGDVALELFALIGPGDYAHLVVGWPMSAFEGIIVRDVHNAGCAGRRIGSEQRDYLRNTKHSRGPWKVVGSIPYAPLPDGIAVNVIFFSTCTWLCLLGLHKTRSLLRLKLRLCPECKYPIGISPVCTECGRKLPRHVIEYVAPLDEAGVAAGQESSVSKFIL